MCNKSLKKAVIRALRREIISFAARWVLEYLNEEGEGPVKQSIVRAETRRAFPGAPNHIINTCCELAYTIVRTAIDEGYANENDLKAIEEVLA